MVNSIISDVTTDLKAGTWSNYSSCPNIIKKDSDMHKGGNTYIQILNETRNPLQLVNGPELYTIRKCDVLIQSVSETNINNIREDVLTILSATNRGYAFINERYFHDSESLFRLIITVSATL